MSEDKTPPDPFRGIFLKVVSVAIFVAMFSLIKAAGQVPAGEAVFFRSFFAMLPILAVLALRRELSGAFRTERPIGHVARGTVGVISMGLGFFALTRLPLPETITLQYSQPLLVVVFSALFIGETVRVFRWSAVAIGLVGVLIISWPKLTVFGGEAALGHDEALGAAAAITSAGFSAAAMILVRRLVHTERTPTIVLWFSVTATVLALMTIPFGWVTLSPLQAALLVGAGFCGGVAQILLTESYRHADISTIAPFDYTSILFGTAAGYVIFGDVPGIHMVVGGAIVIAAGLFIIWREHRLGLPRGAARRITPPQ